MAIVGTARLLRNTPRMTGNCKRFNALATCAEAASPKQDRETPIESATRTRDRFRHTCPSHTVQASKRSGSAIFEFEFGGQKRVLSESTNCRRNPENDRQAHRGWKVYSSVHTAVVSRPSRPSDSRVDKPSLSAESEKDTAVSQMGKRNGGEA